MSNFKDSDNMDTKILSLKKWSFPQVKRILPEKDKPIKYGDYVSFKSHHFIDIISVKNDKETPFLSAYTKLETLRKKKKYDTWKKNNVVNSVIYDEIHTVQNITIVGEKNDFWKKKTNIMYITFIQLTEVGCEYKNAYEKVKERITKLMADVAKREKSIPRWALYYSLDFCDYVLFSTNISCKEITDITWELSLIRSKELSIIKDTFTMYSFNYKYLLKAYQNIDNGHNVLWNEKMAMSADISIPSLETYKKFISYLEQEGISLSRNRILGRYDIRLTSENIKGNQMLKFLYALDKYGTKDSETSFGGYEVQFLNLDHKEIPESFNPNTQPNRFEIGEIIKKYMQKVVEHTCSNYIYETQRSLSALMKNGFSDEFVMSVFDSFVIFVKIISTLKARKIDNVDVDEIATYYFNALNTLSLCTMHSERQFIQAPAFNANYFDVPPKLLAFYTAISFEITNNLSDESETNYTFLITPDYRNDIHVRALGDNHLEKNDCHLGIVYLSEKSFYDPITAIYLLIHEFGHYVGNRKRKERAKHILNCIIFNLFNSANLIPSETTIEKNSIIYSTIACISDYFIDLILEEYNNKESEIYIKNIEEFLQDSDYLMNLFENDTIKNELTEKLKNEIINCLNFENNKEEINKILGKETYEFVDNLSMEDLKESKSYLTDLLIARIFYKLQYFKFYNNNDFKLIFERLQFFSSLTIQSFIETFSDLQIYKVLGDDFNLKRYEHLLNTLCEGEEVTKKIRHDVVLSMISHDNVNEWLSDFQNNDDKDNTVVNFIVDELKSYIKQFTNKKFEKESSEIKSAVHNLESGNINDIFNTIHTTIAKYNDSLFQKHFAP